MHEGNIRVWRHFAEKYEPHIRGKRLIEFGSAYVNGSIRPVFEHLVSEHVGVDWRSGKNVDVVSLAHEVDFAPESFGVVASASMLEHDPYWRDSLAKMVEVLKPGGLIMLTWGGPNNKPHNRDHACDGKFHPRSFEDIDVVVRQHGVRVDVARAEVDYKFNRELHAIDVRRRNDRAMGARDGLTLAGFKEER